MSGRRRPLNLADNRLDRSGSRSTASRGLLLLAGGLFAAVTVMGFAPADSRLERPVAAAALGSSLGVGLIAGAGPLRRGFRRRRGLPDLRAVAGVRALFATLAKRDDETAVHCTRVARVADVVAGELGGLSASRRQDLRTACLLHDIGKIWVPLPILRKNAALDEDEQRRLRAHCADGSDLALSALTGAFRVSQIIRQHHERIDGRGYPEGIGGDQILLEARIVAVADALDAMVFDRPYRRGMPLADAIKELRRSSGVGPGGEQQFDPGVVEALTTRLSKIAKIYGLPQEAQLAFAAATSV